MSRNLNRSYVRMESRYSSLQPYPLGARVTALFRLSGDKNKLPRLSASKRAHTHTLPHNTCIHIHARISALAQPQANYLFSRLIFLRPSGFSPQLIKSNTRRRATRLWWPWRQVCTNKKEHTRERARARPFHARQKIR